MKTKKKTAPATRRKALVAALQAAPNLARAKATAVELLKEREREGMHKDAMPTKSQFDKFFEHVEVREGGCWEWTGRLTNDGLPVFPDCPENVKDDATGLMHGARLHPVRRTGESKDAYAKRDKKFEPMAKRTAFVWFRGVLLPYPHWKMTQSCTHRACVQPAHLRQVRVQERKDVTVTTANLAEVFGHVEVTPHLGSNCWLWTGLTNSAGYAVASFFGQPVQSIDLLTQEWFSTYGDGESAVTHQIYHRCLRRRCVNPAHFELVPYGTRAAKVKESEEEATKTGEQNA